MAEDEPSNFMYLEALLEDFSYNIEHAENGLEAVEIFKSKQIDFILMDMKMPVMNGVEATKQIRDLDSNVPIIAQTAYAMSNDRQKAIDAGCNDYISKPISSELFAKLIKTYI